MPARRLPWLTLARAAWAALALVIVALYGAGLAHELSQPATLCSADTTVVCDEAEAAAVMARLGFPNWYAQFAVVLHDVVIPLGYLIMALLIFWRARDNWLGLSASVLLVVYALWANTDVLDKLAGLWGGGPGWLVFFYCLDCLTFAALAFLLLTFPAGRFARAWQALGWGLMSLLMVLSVNGLLFGQAGAIIFMLLLLGGLAYQVYRYRRVSTPTQRQQAKWVLVGLAGFAANGVIWFVFVEAAVERGAEGVGALAVFSPINTLLALSLPVALAISMLRYRLWDIDLIIRRTLVYSVLTVALALVYLGSVLILQNLLRVLTGQSQSPLVTVLSTLAIAALFVPIRGAVQRVIDRRFYRRKYDAARILSQFNAAARDEVDLTRLADDLVGVVDQTMQPATISLWLNSPDPKGLKTHWVSS